MSLGSLLLGLVIGFAIGGGAVFWVVRSSAGRPQHDPPIPVAAAGSVQPGPMAAPAPASGEDERGMTDALDASDKVLTELEKRYRGRKAGPGRD
ncbi:MAG: hypothetical protein ABI838_02595 [Chloroflexota bacterium]